MRFSELPDWLHWLEQQHPLEIELGLERISTVAKRLSLLTPNAKVITVAGTNGKGSFVTTLHALLRSRQCRVASYTSPHIHTFNERIKINDELVDDATLMQAFAAIDIAKQQAPEISLSYFEYTTLAALYVFTQTELDFWILEVGLGGRLDGVNIIDPDWAVLTSIALDHQDFLGDDIEVIAAEKLGILRRETPLLNLVVEPYQAITQAKTERRVLQLGEDFNCTQTGKTWQFDAEGIHYNNLADNGLAINSQSGAVMLANELLGETIEPSVVKSELDGLVFAGRFNRFHQDGVDIFLDVAHNPQAAQLLSKRLQAYPLAEGAKRIAVFTMFANKDADAVIECLNKEVAAWFLAESDNPRAFKAHELSAKLHQHGINMISVSKNLRQALARAKMLCQPGDQIVIFGSFVVATELLPKLLAR